MNNKIREFSISSLKEVCLKLFGSNILIREISFVCWLCKELDISIFKNQERPTDYYSIQDVVLIIEDRTKCPDGQIAVVDVEKHISYKNNRTEDEVRFVETLNEAAAFIGVTFGTCKITFKRDEHNFIVEDVPIVN